MARHVVAQVAGVTKKHELVLDGVKDLTDRAGLAVGALPLAGHDPPAQLLAVIHASRMGCKAKKHFFIRPPELEPSATPLVPQSLQARTMSTLPLAGAVATGTRQ